MGKSNRTKEELAIDLIEYAKQISELNDNITNHNDFLLNDNKKFQVVLYQRESELIDLEKKLKQLKMSLIF